MPSLPLYPPLPSSEMKSNALLAGGGVVLAPPRRACRRRPARLLRSVRAVWCVSGGGARARSNLGGSGRLLPENRGARSTTVILLLLRKKKNTGWCVAGAGGSGGARKKERRGRGGASPRAGPPSRGKHVRVSLSPPVCVLCAEKGGWVWRWCAVRGGVLCVLYIFLSRACASPLSANIPRGGGGVLSEGRAACGPGGARGRASASPPLSRALSLSLSVSPLGCVRLRRGCVT